MPREKRQRATVPATSTIVEDPLWMLLTTDEHPENEHWFFARNTWYCIYDRTIWTVSRFDWHNGYWYPGEWSRVEDVNWE